MINLYQSLRNKKDLLIKIIGLIGLIMVGFVFYTNRAFLLKAPNKDYISDLYQHSQWSLPLSKRIMSDNELYQHSSLKLAQGADPFSISPEVPPMGKYLYSLGWLIGNPFYISASLYLIIVVVVGITVHQLTKSKNLSMLAAVLAASSPLLIAQVSQVMMDLPLVTFLLVHLLSFYLSTQASKLKYKLLWVTLAGLSLAGYAGSKFFFYLPLVLIADLWLMSRTKRIKLGIIAWVVGFFSFLAGYTQYFSRGNSILSWAKSLVWAGKFYLKSNLKPTYLQLIKASFLAQYFDAGSGQTVAVQEWSILWPITITIVILLLLSFFSKKINQYFKFDSSERVFFNYLAIIFILYTAQSLFLPFQARYFLPILLLGLPFVMSWLNKFNLSSGLVLIAHLILIGQLINYTYRPPKEQAKVISQTLSTQNYHDTYPHLSSVEDFTSFDKFHQHIAQNVDQPLQILERRVNISLNQSSLWSSQIEGELHQDITTIYGVIRSTQPVRFIRKQGQWKMNWDWNYLVENYQPDCQLMVKPFQASYPLLTSDEVTLSEITKQEKIKLNLEGVSVDSDLIKALSQATNIIYPRLEQLLINTKRYHDWVGLMKPYRLVKDIDELSERLGSNDLAQMVADITEPWIVYQRKSRNSLSKDMRTKVSQIQSTRPDLADYIGAELTLSCQDKKYQQTISSQGDSVQLDITYQSLTD
jgi:hypothetical protein